MSSSLDSFLAGWQQDTLQVKPFVQALYEQLSLLPDTELDFKARPGISYSLRAKHVKQQGRPLFVLVDIIDDEPEARWLSVCFYDAFISDPEETGDQVPGGLFNEDARCFDVDTPGADPAYIQARILEAHKAAAISE